MPIYNFKCICGNEFESIVPLGTEAVRCKCTGFAWKQFTPTHFIPFRPYTDFDMTGQPIEIGSPGRLSKELHKRGLEITDRPLRHKSKKKGISEKTKKLLAESLGKEMQDAPP